MLAIIIIVFREALEIALIIGAVFGFIKKTSQKELQKILYIGIVCGVAASIICGWGLNSIFSFRSSAVQLFLQGVTLLSAAVFVVGMLWLNYHHQKTVGGATQMIEKMFLQKEEVGLFLYVFFSVARDGMEAIVLLRAADIANQAQMVLGGILGAVAAGVVGVGVAKGVTYWPVKNVFRFTNIFLLLLAGTLLIQGGHEMLEAAERLRWIH